MLLFFFNDPPTTEIYTLSLHDALPICQEAETMTGVFVPAGTPKPVVDLLQREISAIVNSPDVKAKMLAAGIERSEEHTSELQSQSNLVCRLLLEKKKKKITQEHLADTP